LEDEQTKEQSNTGNSYHPQHTIVPDFLGCGALQSDNWPAFQPAGEPIGDPTHVPSPMWSSLSQDASGSMTAIDSPFAIFNSAEEMGEMIALMPNHPDSES
jgi:hypothetical protein